MLRKFLLCTVASAALPAHVALAADLPLKAPPPPAMAWSWAGFYLGAHGGYGWGSNNFSTVTTLFPTVRIEGIDSRGWLGGGHAGYNWQSGRWVAGMEADVSAGIRGNSAPGVIDTGGGNLAIRTFSDEVKYLGTARLRAGGVPFANQSVMLYGTAGLAWERINRTDTTVTVAPPPTVVRANTVPNDRFGWVAGVGGEFRLGASNWIGRVEYLHYDFGMIEAPSFILFGGQTWNSSGGRQTIDAVRGGISYKFGQPPAPLSAYAAYAPGKASPSPMAWSWAGFYLGAHGGYGWARNNYALNPGAAPPSIPGVDTAGWLAGAHGGYNWQFGRWVTGFEIDGSRTWIRGDSDIVTAFFTTASLGDDVKYLGTVRARLGGTPFANSNLLLYGTAGLAWERFERNSYVNTAQIIYSLTTAPRDHFGWVAGAGGELRLGATNWIGRVEYLHYDFGTVETVNSSVTTPANIFDFASKGGRHTIDVVRGGVSYKFGPDGASSAYAAYASAAPVPAPAWSWGGYYLGAHGGYGWGQNDFARLQLSFPNESIGGIDSRGWLGGGQAGYNWQFDRWVAGLELDGSASRIGGEAVPISRTFAPTTTTTRWSDDVKYVGTLRARFGGVPFANADVLLYGTAGLAWERVNRSTTNIIVSPQLSQVNSSITPRNPFGWVAGAGGEFRLGATNWIGRVEYLHYDFGTIETPVSQVTTPASPSDYADKGGRQTIDVVRAGVSYKFGG